ncbi:putative uncharacterized protein [Brachyspira sp. CAG:484]|nr:putative uncharacterized protein [Brachyspira sp. CAG:484]
MTYIINTYSGKENIMRALKIISYILVIIGALNWGLVGLFNIDLVALIFGEMTILARIVYILVGISAIISLITSYRDITDYE